MRLLILNFLLIPLITLAAEPSIINAHQHNKIMPGDYKPKLAIIQPLKHAVPIQPGAWRHALTDNKGLEDISSSIEECSAHRDWREVVREVGTLSEEGCEPIKLIEKTLGKTKTAGTSEVCHQGSKTLTRTSWLIPKSANNKPLNAYEVVTVIQLAGSKKTEIERSLHTWVGLCPDQQGKLLGE